MPFTLDPDDRPISRRAALAAAGVAAVLAGRPARASRPADAADAWIALVSDTHIAADPRAILREQVMADNLRAVVADVLSLESRPEALFVDGDLALKDGQFDDYRTFLDLIAPLRRAGMPIHLALGNHDDRGKFREVVKAEAPHAAGAGDKHVSAVEAAGLRFLVLDSLDVVNGTPGRLGDAQRGWLAAELDARPEAPAVVLVHHNPLAGSNASLVDTDELLKVLHPRRQAKALVFGHTHVWNVVRDEAGLYRINLPAVAYPFTPIQPLGWVRFRPTPAGGSLELRCVGGNRQADRKVVELACVRLSLADRPRPAGVA